MSTKDLFVLILTTSCKLQIQVVSSHVVMDTILVTDLTCVNMMLFLVPFVIWHFFLQTKQFHAGCNLISVFLSKRKITKGAFFNTYNNN